jgi:hypothetical protein
MAARLNGREYPFHPAEEEQRLAAEHGLVILYGASDDLAEFRGAIYDEAGAGDGTFLEIVDGKLAEVPDCDCRWALAAREAISLRARKIEAVWCEDGTAYSWTYKTDIPHATFEVVEDGEPYCRGIVFALADAR